MTQNSGQHINRRPDISRMTREAERLASQGFYGEVTTSFKAGQPVRMEIKKSIRLDDK